MALSHLQAAVCAICLWGAGCARTPARSAVEEMNSCVPSGTIVLAGAHLDRVRGNALFQKLSGDALSVLEPMRDADSLLAAYNGSDFVLIGHGLFTKAPAGATLVTANLAVGGSAGAVQAVARQHATGQTGAPALVAWAQPVSSEAIWAVAAGGATLPLQGNLANLNRLLRLTDHATLGVDLNAAVMVHATGYGRSADAARQLEETLRSFVSLGAATTRDRDLEAVLKKVTIAREGTIVRVSAAATAEEIGKLVEGVGH